jgi:putative oxidoreductase
MKYLYTIARLLLGSIFLIFGLNGFYTFIPVPEYHPFMKILVESGYIYLIKTIEVTAGILLLSNRFVPLALLLLAMDIVNITAYHILLDPRNWIVVPIVITLWIILSINYKSSFTPLFTVKTKGVYS